MCCIDLRMNVIWDWTCLSNCDIECLSSYRALPMKPYWANNWFVRMIGWMMIWSGVNFKQTQLRYIHIRIYIVFRSGWFQGSLEINWWLFRSLHETNPCRWNYIFDIIRYILLLLDSIQCIMFNWKQWRGIRIAIQASTVNLSKNDVRLLLLAILVLAPLSNRNSSLFTQRSFGNVSRNAIFEELDRASAHDSWMTK